MDLNIECYFAAALPIDAGEVGVCSVAEPSGSVLQHFLVTHYKQLQRKLAHHLGCKDFASECLHETWLRLGQTALAAPIKSQEAYLYRMACNIAIDSLRRKRTLEYLDDAAEELARLADPAGGPDMATERRLALAAMDRAMHDMPARNRNVLIALRVEEKSRQEVAAYYGLSLRTVDNALRAALDYCRSSRGQQALPDPNRLA